MTRTDLGAVTGTLAAAAFTIVMSLAAPSQAVGQGRTVYQRPTYIRLRSLTSAADSAALILRYARMIAESAFVKDSGAGDTQRLMLGTCPDSCRYGPLATIQPRLRSARWTRAHRDSGEVIARIISDGPYPKFNIQGRDTVYWWVGRRGDRPVSIFTSTRPGVRPFVSDLEVTYHVVGYWTQAIARWLWRERDEAAWATCDGGACCKSSGLALR